MSFGADVQFHGMQGTVDLLYIRGVDQLDLVDVNLAPPTRVSAGEGGRVLMESTTRAMPHRID